MSKPKAYNQYGQFDSFMADFNQARLLAGHVYLNNYLDASGTIYDTDNNGNAINDRWVYYITYTLPYNDPVSQSPMPGFLTVVFNDHSYIRSYTNDESSHWYSIVGTTPFVIKQLT